MGFLWDFDLLVPLPCNGQGMDQLTFTSADGSRERDAKTASVGASYGWSFSWEYTEHTYIYK